MESTNKLEKSSKLKQISGFIGLDKISKGQKDNSDDKIKHDKADSKDMSLSENGSSQVTPNQPFSKSDLSDIKMIDDTCEESYKSDIEKELIESQDMVDKKDETIENINLGDNECQKVIETEEVNRLKCIKFNDRLTSIPFDRSASASCIGKPFLFCRSVGRFVALTQTNTQIQKNVFHA